MPDGEEKSWAETERITLHSSALSSQVVLLLNSSKLLPPDNLDILGGEWERRIKKPSAERNYSTKGKISLEVIGNRTFHPPFTALHVIEGGVPMPSLFSDIEAKMFKNNKKWLRKFIGKIGILKMSANLPQNSHFLNS